MLLSVIIPVYNVEKYLEKCVKSVINQTFQDMEIIVVNDGSTDSSLDICKKMASVDSRIILIDKKNGGLSDARNVGLDIAKGQYIAFLDSDDYLCESAYETMLGSAIKDDLDIVVGYPIITYEDGKCEHTAKRRKVEESIVSGEEYLVSCVNEASMLWPVQFSVYKHDLIKDLKFKKGVLHEDMLWTPQAFLKAKRVKCLDYEFYYYLMRSQSITHTANKYKNGCDLINSCYDLEPIYKKIDNKHHRDSLMDNLVEHYLNGFYVARLVKSTGDCQVRKSFLLGKAKKARNVIKTMIFLVNKRMYLWLNDRDKKRGK